jgi:hypothetical protein
MIEPQDRSPGFTLILTKGTHLVSDKVAEQIVAAIEADEKLIKVDLDLFGRIALHRETTIVAAHVVCLTKNIVRTKAPDDPKVTAITRRRHA